MTKRIASDKYRILSIDPGAFRLGYAVIERDHLGFRLVVSGIKGITREPNEAFGVYKTRLMDYWYQDESDRLFALAGNIDEVVSERVPAVGGGNFVGPQSELVKMVVTVLQIKARDLGIPWRELSARTIQSKLTGNKKVTKVQVRNVVIETFPELESRKKELTDTADESDSIGVGLVALGFDAKDRRKKQ